MNTRIRKEERAPCSRDSEAEDEVPPRIPIAVRKAQGIWKITLKVKIVKAGIGSLNYEGKSPVLKMMISPNLGSSKNGELQRSKRSIPEKLRPTEKCNQRNPKVLPRHINKETGSPQKTSSKGISRKIEMLKEHRSA
ncbi:hypothetical protein Tco_0792181 [Tanacetum coccineum]